MQMDVSRRVDSLTDDGVRLPDLGTVTIRTVFVPLSAAAAGLPLWTLLQSEIGPTNHQFYNLI